MATRERRRESRYQVLGLRGWTPTREPLVVRDFSRSGIRIETVARPRPGTGFRFRIPAPEGEIDIETRCAWAHLAGVQSLLGQRPATVYTAGLRRDPERLPRRLLMLLRRHTIFPPDQPLSCLLSAEQSPSGRPLAGEVRRIGLQGVSVLFPSLPPLETSRVDLVLLLGGSDCVCGCHLLEQRRIIVSRESRALELLLAFDGSDPGAMAPLYRYLESMEREMERAGIPEDERPLTADETSGSTSMSA